MAEHDGRSATGCKFTDAASRAQKDNIWMKCVVGRKRCYRSGMSQWEGSQWEQRSLYCHNSKPDVSSGMQPRIRPKASASDPVQRQNLGRSAAWGRAQARRDESYSYSSFSFTWNGRCEIGIALLSNVAWAHWNAVSQAFRRGLIT
jgi:hypothetical protein